MTKNDEPTFRDDRPRFRVRCTDCDWSATVHGRNQSATAVIGHGLRTGHDAEKERAEDRDR